MTMRYDRSVVLHAVARNVPASFGVSRFILLLRSAERRLMELSPLNSAKAAASLVTRIAV